MPRTTKADLESRIEDLEEQVAEQGISVQIAEFERDDWARTAQEHARMLSAVESERDFLRSIVHGLVPASIQ